jgi:hypothetical protein
MAIVRMRCMRLRAVARGCADPVSAKADVLLFQRQVSNLPGCRMDLPGLSVAAMCAVPSACADPVSAKADCVPS